MSSLSLLTAACVIIYVICSWLLWQGAKSDQIRIISPNIIQILIAMAIVIHGYLLYIRVFSESGASISFGLAISMAGWISVTLYLSISLFKKITNLGVIVLPIGLISVLVGTLAENPAHSIDPIQQGMGLHIVLAIPAYGILCIAFAQACLLILQDRELRKPTPGKILLALPAIQTMESNLFWLTITGFIFLTLNLVVGMGSNVIKNGDFLIFNHHVLLSILAWICFGSLILGRKIAGWRGETAAKWTIFAFGILVLSYFGTRFVNDFIIRN